MRRYIIGGVLILGIVLYWIQPVKITGRLLAADGSTPISGAYIAIKGYDDPLRSCVASNNQSCSDANGNFSIKVTRSFFSSDLVFYRGPFRKAVKISRLTSQNLTKIMYDDKSIPRIAVVTGEYDKVELIMGKLIGSNIDPSNENSEIKGLDLYDGELFGDGELYEKRMQVDELFAMKNGKPNIYNYGYVMFNCGRIYSELAKNEEYVKILRDYVLNGGYVYASDWADSLIKMAFPDEIRFDEIRITDMFDEEHITAHHGTEEGITRVSYEVSMQKWIEAAKCKKCTDHENFKESFLPAWSIMNKNQPEDTRVYMRGDVEAYNPDMEVINQKDVPLAIIFSAGKGKVLFTSYHIEGEDASTEVDSSGYTPQEEIFRYLLFLDNG